MWKKQLNFGNFLAIAFVALVFTSGVTIGYSYFTAKWLLIYALGAFASGWLLISKNLPFPKWDTKVLLLFVAVIVGAIGNTIWLSPSGFENSLLDRCSFFVLVYFSYVAFQRKVFRWNLLLWPVIVSCASVAVYGLWQISQQSLAGDFPYTKVGSLFGYSNNTAQFLGICLVYLGFRSGLKFWSNLALRLSFILGMAYILVSQCRSVYLGLFLVALFYVFKNRRQRKPIFTIGGTLLVSFLLMLLVQASREGKFNLFQSKELLTSFRVGMAKATWHMIEENPLGIGVDLYEYKALPYLRKYTPELLNDDFLSKSPHNEFLRYPVEDGLPVSAVFLLGFCFLVYAYRKTMQRQAESEDNFVLALAIFFLSEMVAQFPFQNPVPVFVFSIYLAWIFYRCFESVEFSRDIYRPIFLLFLIAQLWCGYLVGYSRLNEKSEDLEVITQACAYLPSNWHACLVKAKLEIQGEKMQSARTTLENLLRLQPDNLVAMRDLSVVAFHDAKIFQRRLEACYYLWRYVDGYAGNTSVASYLKQNCPERWIQYFNAKHPSAFYSH